MSPGDEISPAKSDWILVALASIGTAIIVTDTDGRVVSMNPVAETLTGWPQGEAVGRTLANVFRIENEDSRQPVADPVAAVLATGAGAAQVGPTVLVARDGTEWLLDDGAAPLRDGGGGVVGVVLVFRDVSERRRIERAKEDARAYAEGIVEAVREPLVVLDSDLRVRTANRAFYRTFGTTPTRTEGRFLFDLGDRQWDIPRLRALLTDVLTSSAPFDDFEVDREFAGVGRRVMLLNARPLPLAGGRTRLILLAIEDDTDRREAAAALAMSEARYRRLFETAQDAILIVDADTRRVFDANPFLTDLLGYTWDELIGKELWEIGLFRDIESSQAAFRTLQEKRYIRYEDLPLETKDGRPIEVEFVSNVYSVGEARVIQCNIRDITDRKRAEAELRAAYANLEARVIERTAQLGHSNGSLKAEIARREQAEAARHDLQLRLATAQEDERRRIARELHDQMGQHLTALSLGLKLLWDASPDPSLARERLPQLQELTALIGREVHNLALELRPTSLDDLGLATALRTYGERWAGRTGIELDFHATGPDTTRVPPAIETALYRVVLEALANVHRHAGARRVSVILQRSEGLVSTVVEDDGQGFDADTVPAAAGGEGRLGLLGMRERLALVGGTLTIESAPGRGTTVIARVPIEEGGHD